MNTTAHLLSTEANKKRLLESIAQDKKTSRKAGLALPEENILLLYAGHSQYHPKLKCSYWQPSDADPTSQATWIGLPEILSFIKVSEAHHISIISDSCYAGAIFEMQTRGGGLLSLSARKSRQALMSGGIEAVLDGHSDDHSPFAKTIIELLTNNQEKELSFDLFAHNVVLKFDSSKKQSPIYGNLNDVGHEGGSFVFGLKQPDSKLEKGLDKNEFLKSRLKNFYIPLTNEILERINRINEIKAKKNAVVKAQRYDKAAELRDVEKQEILAVENKLRELIDDRKKSFLQKFKFSENDLRNHRELDSEVQNYLETRHREIKAFEKLEAKLKKGSQKSERSSSLDLMRHLFGITNPALKLFNGKQNELIEKYEVDVMALYELICFMRGTSNNEIFEKIVSDLEQILVQICDYEMTVLMGDQKDYIKENLWRKEIEVKMLRWLSGNFEWEQDATMRSS